MSFAKRANDGRVTWHRFTEGQNGVAEPFYASMQAALTARPFDDWTLAVMVRRRG